MLVYFTIFFKRPLILLHYRKTFCCIYRSCYLNIIGIFCFYLLINVFLFFWILLIFEDFLDFFELKEYTDL